jgi:phosphate transport system substrate-binding protein
MSRKIILGSIVLAVPAAVGLVWTISCGGGDTVKLQGAGATFPEPVYNQWMTDYGRETGARINYEGIGSGGGQKAILAKTIDYAGSDEPMKPEDLEKSGLLQFPMVVGGVVPVIKVPGIESNQLRLTPDLLGRIFAGDIKTWGHADIAAVNPGLALPAENILVVHRSDGSGTTWTFTYFLHRMSDHWRNAMMGREIDRETGEVEKEAGVSYGKAMKWPEGTVGQKGNPGVANMVKESKYSIGYVEYAYALQNNLTTVKLQNPVGKFVEPNLKSFAEAAVQTDWTRSGVDLIPVAKPGENTWPVVGVSFIIIYKEQSDEAKGKGMLRYFDWCLEKGGEAAERLHYVPLPKNVAEMVREQWKKEVRFDGEPLWK